MAGFNSQRWIDDCHSALTCRDYERLVALAYENDPGGSFSYEQVCSETGEITTNEWEEMVVATIEEMMADLLREENIDADTVREQCRDLESLIDGENDELAEMLGGVLKTLRHVRSQIDIWQSRFDNPERRNER